MLHDCVMGLVGGLLLGVASVGLMLFNGRVLGVSGILGGALPPASNDVGWRWFFIAGMALVGSLIAFAHPSAFAITVVRSPAACVIAGMLVGVGTQLGNGCTSGHGICGIGRLSKRSIVATLAFMLTGAISVYFVEHVLGGSV